MSATMTSTIEVGTAVRVKYGRGRPANATVTRVYANGDLGVTFNGRTPAAFAGTGPNRVSVENVTVL